MLDYTLALLKVGKVNNKLTYNPKKIMNVKFFFKP